MKTYTIHIFLPDAKGGMRESPQKFQIKANSVDDARDEAKELAEFRGHVVRNLNFGPDNKILIYTDPAKSKKKAPQIKGWRFKKAPSSSPKKDA